MTVSSMDLDRILKAALAERTAGGSGQLLEEIVRAAESTPQRGSWGTIQLPRMAVVFAATILVLTLLGAVAVGAGLLPLPEPPSPPAPQTIENPQNGAVVISAGDAIVGTTLDDSVSPLSRPVAAVPWASLTFSPNGLELAYAGSLGDGPPEVFVLDVATREARRVGPCEYRCELAWDPTGSRSIASAMDTRIVLMDADSGAQSEVWSDETSATEYSYPTMSPDGQWIAFRRTDPDGDSLVKVRVDGSEMTVLAGADASLPYGGENYVTSSWSPDGSTIVYLTMAHREDYQESAMHSLSLRAIDADGGQPRTVADLGECACLNLWPGVAWSPDGRRLAVNAPLLETNTFALYVMNPDGTGLAQVGSGGRGAPAWQPIP